MPTIGVMGAVLGLIHVMMELDHPAELGGGIATAFVATIYGVGTANLIALPLGARLGILAEARERERHLILQRPDAAEAGQVGHPHPSDHAEPARRQDKKKPEEVSDRRRRATTPWRRRSDP